MGLSEMIHNGAGLWMTKCDKILAKCEKNDKIHAGNFWDRHLLRLKKANANNITQGWWRFLTAMLDTNRGGGSSAINVKFHSTLIKFIP